METAAGTLVFHELLTKYGFKVLQLTRFEGRKKGGSMVYHRDGTLACNNLAHDTNSTCQSQEPSSIAKQGPPDCFRIIISTRCGHASTGSVTWICRVLCVCGSSEAGQFFAAQIKWGKTGATGVPAEGNRIEAMEIACDFEWVVNTLFLKMRQNKRLNRGVAWVAEGIIELTKDHGASTRYWKCKKQKFQNGLAFHRKLSRRKENHLSAQERASEPPETPHNFTNELLTSTHAEAQVN
ncbi:hypothetical protein EV401DRAFT_2140985 [Pisolithus croceorrhizus]|nr:hypothetical protein EV401DRAFT_2140985 [Pisolithus croceorrhizus]